MPIRRYVRISFNAPDVGTIAESIARNQIVNKAAEVGGLGWELAWSHPMFVYRDFEDEESFERAVAELQQRVVGIDAIREVSLS
jgi:hypothetical protein